MPRFTSLPAVATAALAALWTVPQQDAAAFAPHRSIAAPITARSFRSEEGKQAQTFSPRPVASRLEASSSDGEGREADAAAAATPPDFVTSPVLRQVYPALLANVASFGHPNIPLGTTEGKRCKTLRRLAFERKLSSREVDLLTELGFRFNSLEDVYDEADFDDCLARLVRYEEENKTGYQIPKKYEPDPELGAWVTMIRRIGRDRIEEDRGVRLDDVGFAWVSTRKCGSSFMRNYRGIKERLIEGGESAAEDVLADEEARKWLRAQKEAESKGNLSEDRVDYLDKLVDLPGSIGWRDV